MRTFGITVVVLVVLAVLVLILLPSVTTPRSVIYQVQCKNNLKFIGLALHNYHDEYGTFPPACMLDEEGRPAHSWRVLILPFVDELELYSQYRFDEPWNGPNNAKLAGWIPQLYRCPSFMADHRDPESSFDPLNAMTNYVAVVALDGVFDRDRATALDEITDGPGKTLTIIEARQHAVHWMQPEDVTEPEILLDLLTSRHPQMSNHTGGLHALFADGSVPFVLSESKPSALRAMVTRDAGDEWGGF